MKNLNERQLEAVKFYKGKMLVLAGPGSGKTTIITHRVKYLIDEYKVPSDSILVITFTKAAAEEMKERFVRISGQINHKAIFATFHSFFFRIIRKTHGYGLEDILSDEEKKEIIYKLARGNLKFDIDDEFIKSVENEISSIDSNLIDIHIHSSNVCGNDEFRSIYKGYREYKEKNNKIDFDDMIKVCYEDLSGNKNLCEHYRNRYKFILVDEFQDINRAQYECTKLLTDENLFVVGDDDQSIYGFRGAAPEIILNFKDDFPESKIITLNKNYRSTENIVSFCSEVISQNKNRYGKKIQGRGVRGNKPKLLIYNDTSAEALGIAQMIKKMPNKNDIAVIFRTNVQARAFVTNFMNMNIPYKLKDQLPSLYENWAAKDILSYMKYCINPLDLDSLYKIINRPKRYVSKVMFAGAKKHSNDVLDNMLKDNKLPLWRKTPIEELVFHLDEMSLKTSYESVKYIRKMVGYDNFIKEFSKAQKINSDWLFELIDEFQESARDFPYMKDFVSYAENFRPLKNNSDCGVTLTTMHSSKGLEFETVFLTGVVEGLIPHDKSGGEKQIEEECRLFYVGLSRAKNNLFISTVKNRYELPAKLTRFLDGFELVKANGQKKHDRHNSLS